MELKLFIILLWLVSGHLILLADDHIGRWRKLDTAMLGQFTKAEYLWDGCNRCRKKSSLAFEAGIVSLLGPLMIVFLFGIYLGVGIIKLFYRDQTTLATL